MTTALLAATAHTRDSALFRLERPAERNAGWQRRVDEISDVRGVADKIDGEEVAGDQGTIQNKCGTHRLRGS